MDSIYKKTKSYYENIVQKIIKKNINLLDSKKKKNLPKEEFPINFFRVGIPIIEKDPSSNFFIITDINLHTKDDPFLKFLPSTCDTTAINWYEGTTIGDNPFETKDAINNLFLSHCKKTGCIEAAHNYLKLKYEQKPKKSLKKLFCNVCLIFGCGIHKISPGKVLKYNEPSNCICKNSHSNSSKNFPKIKYINYSAINLKSCIKKKINDLLVNESNIELITENKIPQINDSIPCGEYFNRSKKIPTKIVHNSHKNQSSLEFFYPCKHDGPCRSPECSCASNGINCELSCFCVSCKNMRFCRCNNCGISGCCFSTKRECSELCHPSKITSNNCSNMDIQLKNEKATTVFKSKFHGLGLFSDEIIIKNGEFVMEYTGEVISDKEAERRGNFYEANSCSYLFDLNKVGNETIWSIDAFAVGGISRYINHSLRKANLNSEVAMVGGLNKIVFRANRDIYKGEELLFDYKFTEEHKKNHGIID